MAKGMKSTYTKKGQPTVCRDFSDGSKVCMSKKGWSVFFATINKMGASETKPRPKQTEESRDVLIQWFTEAYIQAPLDDGDPSWVEIANKLIESPVTAPAVKEYWKDKLRPFNEKKAQNEALIRERKTAVESVLGIINEEIKKMEN
jgi:hypothetical protein